MKHFFFQFQYHEVLYFLLLLYVLSKIYFFFLCLGNEKIFTSCLKNSCFVCLGFFIFLCFHFFSSSFLFVFISFCFQSLSFSFLLVFISPSLQFFSFSFLQMFLHCCVVTTSATDLRKRFFTLRRFLSYTPSCVHQGFPGTGSSALKVAGLPTEVRNTDPSHLFESHSVWQLFDKQGTLFKLFIICL